MRTVDLILMLLTNEQDGNERIPEPPSSGVEQGVLPRLIATLVNRRRQVKSLMKDKKATPAQLLQVGKFSRGYLYVITVVVSGTSSKWLSS